MRPGFDLDGGDTASTGGAFFLCTETWPRCFVIKQVSDVDAMKEVQQQQSTMNEMPSTALLKPNEPINGPSDEAIGGNLSTHTSTSSPYLPMLPWWFTAECRQHLLGVPGPDEFHNRALTPETRPPSSIGHQPMSQEQLRARLTRQLEYYFSRENLINDRYLRCQMDADQYVPIKIVANFPKVAQLTTDFDLIVDVLKSSSQVQVDEKGTRVRPLFKRCTIILREIPQNADENEVKAMFQGEGCPPYQSLAYGLNDSWYVTFLTESDTQRAFFHLQTIGPTFKGKPVFARIKTGGAPIVADLHNRHSPDGQIRLDGGALRGQLIIHDPLNPFPLIIGGIGTDRTTPSPQQQNGITKLEIQKHATKIDKKDDEKEDGEKADQMQFNLGQILAQIGYVPRATFRPHIPPPTAPIMPPLQPTTTPMAGGTMLNGGLPQPTTFFAQPILHNVGQNEFVLKQIAKECGEAASPVLVPKDVPRITDIPRMNGKGRMGKCSGGKGGAQNATGSVSQPPTSAGGHKLSRHSPPLSSGAGFVGFQRQESVEAYQIALAANGVGNKQKRQQQKEQQIVGKEEKGEEKAELPPAGRINKAIGSGRGSASKSAVTIRTNSSDQPPPRILGSHGPRRSEPAAPNVPHQSSTSSSSFRPLNSESSCPNWRQSTKSQQQQNVPTSQPSTASTTTNNGGISNPIFTEFRPAIQYHWQQQNFIGGTNHPPPSGIIQPLFSLGHIQQPMPMSGHHLQNQQNIGSSGSHSTMHSGNQQQFMPLSGGINRGPNNFDSNRRERGDGASFRGGRGGANNGGGQDYRPRTWTSDWPRENAQQGGGHFQRDAPRGQFGGGGNWTGGKGRGGGQQQSTRGGRRNVEHFYGNDKGHSGGENQQQKEQQQPNRHFGHQRAPPPHFVPASGPHFRHEQRQRSNTTIGSGSGENGGRPHHFQHNHRFREHRQNSDLDKNHSEQSTIADGNQGRQQQHKLLKAGDNPAGYNFEEHVEEFPALSLSQSNSRKASECHGDQQQSLLNVPELQEKPNSNTAIGQECGGGGSTSSNGSIGGEKKAFSAVVASGRPRRATIGTTAIIGGTGTAKSAKEEAGRKKCIAKDEELMVEQKQPRSGTISAGMQILETNESGEGPRSYAQMLKKGGGTQQKFSASANAKECGGQNCSASIAGTEV